MPAVAAIISIIAMAVGGVTRGVGLSMEHAARRQQLLDDLRELDVARAEQMEAYRFTALRAGEVAGRTRAAGTARAGGTLTSAASRGLAATGSADIAFTTARVESELDSQAAYNNVIREAMGHKRVADRYLREKGRVRQRMADEGRAYALNQVSNALTLGGGVASTLGQYSGGGGKS